MIKGRRLKWPEIYRWKSIKTYSDEMTLGINDWDTKYVVTTSVTLKFDGKNGFIWLIETSDRSICTKGLLSLPEALIDAVNGLQKGPPIYYRLKERIRKYRDINENKWKNVSDIYETPEHGKSVVAIIYNEKNKRLSVREMRYDQNDGWNFVKGRNIDKYRVIEWRYKTDKDIGLT